MTSSRGGRTMKTSNCCGTYARYNRVPIHQLSRLNIYMYIYRGHQFSPKVLTGFSSNVRNFSLIVYFLSPQNCDVAFSSDNRIFKCTSTLIPKFWRCSQFKIVNLHGKWMPIIRATYTSIISAIQCL